MHDAFLLYPACFYSMQTQAGLSSRPYLWPETIWLPADSRTSPSRAQFKMAPPAAVLSMYSLFLLPYNLPACCIRYPPLLVWYTVRFCRCCTVSSIFHSCYNAKWPLLYQTVLHSCSNARWKKLSVPEGHSANFLPCEVLFLSFHAKKWSLNREVFLPCHTISWPPFMSRTSLFLAQ